MRRNGMYIPSLQPKYLFWNKKQERFGKMQDGNHKNDTNMKRTIVTLLCTMCLLSNYIAAQTQRMKIISGIVRAEDGNPLSGVLVSTPDKIGFSTISNKDGQFLMEIPENQNTII